MEPSSSEEPGKGGPAGAVSSVGTVRSRPGGRSARVRRAVLDAVVELLEEGGAREVLERIGDWPQFWATRLRRFEPVFARAAARGEVAADVDQSVIASIGEMVAAQTYFLTLFRREEVDDPAARLIVRRALAAAGL